MRVRPRRAGSLARPGAADRSAPPCSAGGARRETYDRVGTAIRGVSAMGHWTNICCAVDFYAPSWLAMQHAAAMARRFGAGLTLVHVIATPPRPAGTGAVPRRVSPGLVEDGERMLERWAADAEPRVGHAVRMRILTGDPAEVLADYAREECVDLLVVGARRAMGLTSITGSLAGRLSRTSPCPVLVVYDHARREREWAEEGTQRWQ